MGLTIPEIIGIISLLLTSIPGILYISRKVRRKLYSQQEQRSNSSTILPLSGYSSPNFGQAGGHSRFHERRRILASA
ncbi:hypothetical protein GGS24DRAFT_471772 [Hypoxylon argillaceum]|nr:hypothetical protein GGS24DRAFT_471772 [Hypoxylon argillaceum]